MTKLRKTEFPTVFAAAHEAGLRAGQDAQPAPMVVGTPANVMGSMLGMDTGFDPDQPTYYVADGVCGFAWVNIRPGTSSFARWLVKTGKARKDSYYGGVTVRVHEFNQSLTRKEAYASAFARVLRDYGINAMSMSRID